MERSFFSGKFSAKKENFQKNSSFLVFSEITGREFYCTVCVITHVPCSTGELRGLFVEYRQIFVWRKISTGVSIQIE